MYRMRKVLLRSASSKETDTSFHEISTVGDVSSKNIPPAHAMTFACSIIVIDDSPTIRNILETCLQREGFEVRTFPDGVEAMRWLVGTNRPIPHLVILDIRLPKLDGYEVARRLKAKSQFRTLPIVMLSRQDSIIDRLKGRLAGANVYMTKPFKTEDIVGVVKMQLGMVPSNDQQHSLITSVISR